MPGMIPDRQTRPAPRAWTGFSFGLALFCGACTSLPQAPSGPIPASLPQHLREYKYRKNHIAIPESAYGRGLSLGGEPIGWTALEGYLTADKQGALAQSVAEARRERGRSYTLVGVGTVLLAPVGVGLFLPLFADPIAAKGPYKRRVRPAAEEFNRRLAGRLGLRLVDGEIESPPPPVGAP